MDAMTTAAQTPASTAAPRGLRVFNALIGVTTLGIFLQAITAGEFVSQEHRGGWIAAHSVIANVTILVALATAVVGLVLVHATDKVLAWSSLALFVLLILQTVLGHLITEGEADGWIGVHVPLAFVIVALAVWLSVRGAQVRRRSA
jgi:lipopolysaccharide export LptBFGC system permease protein LptF